MSNFKIGDRVYNINLGYGTIRACTNKGYWLVDWDEKLIRKISDVEYTDNGVDRRCRMFNYPCDRIRKVLDEKSKFNNEIINDIVNQIMRFLVRFGEVSIVNSSNAVCKAKETVSDKEYILSWEIDGTECIISVGTKMGKIELVTLMKSDMTDEQKSILGVFNALAKQKLEEAKKKSDEKCKRNRELLIMQQMIKAGIVI
jgi:hypothetical protein